jgi:hypothetical protein
VTFQAVDASETKSIFYELIFGNHEEKRIISMIDGPGLIKTEDGRKTWVEHVTAQPLAMSAYRRSAHSPRHSSSQLALRCSVLG